jgi:hypothetical protein
MATRHISQFFYQLSLALNRNINAFRQKRYEDISAPCYKRYSEHRLYEAKLILRTQMVR